MPPDQLPSTSDFPYEHVASFHAAGEYQGVPIFWGVCSCEDYIGPTRSSAREALADAQGHAQEANDAT